MHRSSETALPCPCLCTRDLSSLVQAGFALEELRRLPSGIGRLERGFQSSEWQQLLGIDASTKSASSATEICDLAVLAYTGS